jgi:hypothetical protein
MTANKFLLAAALALAPVLCPAPAAAQLGSRPEEQSFDYDPGAEQAAKVQQSAAETTYVDAEIVNHPIYGTIVISKSRWKNWGTRALYLTLINIALLIIIISIPKTYEYALIVSYVLMGMSSAVSLWTFLCAVLLFQLNTTLWAAALPASLVTGGIGYFLLMRVKRSDVSLSELKESFKKMSAASREDPRLVSVEGLPGDWPAEDFIR